MIVLNWGDSGSGLNEKEQVMEVKMDVLGIIK